MTPHGVTFLFFLNSCPERIARNLASSACLAIMSLLDSHLKTVRIYHKMEVARLHHITALSNVSSVDVMLYTTKGYAYVCNIGLG